MKTWPQLLILCSLSTTSFAQDCKFKTETETQVESKILVLFRGGVVAMGGYFGIKDGQPYLRTRYNSQFKGRASFTAETPLTLKLANGQEVELPVIDEEQSRLSIIGAAFNNRVAQPVFGMTREQVSVLSESPIVSLTLRFMADGTLQSDVREVSGGNGQSMLQVIRCLPIR
jgi:hypothetical protein